jgi:Fe-S oxidoreductase
MFKEEEKGTLRINVERSNEALETGASVIAAACPFCNTMLTDGVKNQAKEDEVAVWDIAELVAASM